MGSSIFFPLSAIPIITIILLAFNLKKHLLNTETKLYNILCIANLIGLLIEISCLYSCKIYDSHVIIASFILKSYLVYLIIWTALFTTYIYNISNPETKSIYNLIHVIFLTAVIALIYILPIEVVVENNYSVHYTQGVCVNFAYFISGLYVIGILYILLKNIKNLKNKKYLPVFIFFVIGTGAIIIQRLYPQYLLLTYSETVICLTMFFTIENPDVKMIEQLNIAKSQADKANKAKTDFLSSMSHEIRTPLNAIVGFSEYILTSNSLDEAKENANDIVEASNTLLEIVNGILDISKIEAGKIEIHNSSYDSYEMLDSIVKLGKGRLGDKPLDYRVNIAEDIPKTLFGDHANLKKIIINLLTNAIKYTDNGYIDFSVKCVRSGDTCRLIVSVEDSGRGIKQKDINKLFTRFQRLDEDRNTTIEGTGLGLAITKQLVDLMGGTIVVHSTYGEGSKFTVAIDQKISNETLEDKKYNNIENLDLTGKKILIVDDNKLNLKVAAKVLEKYNPIVELIESGFECIEKVKTNNYDLILLDDMMPKMSGSETLVKLRLDPYFKTPVVVLTANAISGMEKKYLDQGFDGYLSKPIDKDQLNKILSTFIKVDNTQPVNNNEQVEEKQEVEQQVEVVEEKKEEVEQPNEEVTMNSDTKGNPEYLKSQGVDVDASLELLGDMEMYNETLNAFVEENKDRINRIENNKNSGNMPDYAIDVHALKSDCKYLGFKKLAEIAYDHELKSKEGNQEYVNEHYNELMDEYNKVKEIIYNYI